MDEREQERVSAPRRPRRSSVSIECGRIEEQADPVVPVGDLCRVDGGTRRDHIDAARSVCVPQDREVVDVLAVFQTAAASDDRYRGSVRICSVLINRQAVAVPD
jgi:hypothetical protein